jgi:putative secretion ATPase (PEP-CTERM system associated)
MYTDHYGLSGQPFALTPDPRFYFGSATHRKAMAYLGYGLAQGEGFIVITGEIGTGKTTLVGHLMATVDRARLTAIRIVSTQVQGDDMLRLAAQGMGIAVEGASKADLLARVERFLLTQAREGKRTLLIVDEAQNLHHSALEELRMLSNFQNGEQALLQIFLLGQPEFRDEIEKSGRLEQLRQRVIATHHLEPMEAHEIEPYVVHRLALVGWAGNPVLTPAAYAALFRASGGVPRRLNQLATRLLLQGALDGLTTLDADDVRAVADEQEVAAEAPAAETRPVPSEASTGAAPRPLPMVEPAVLEERRAPDHVLPFRSLHVPAQEDPASEWIARVEALEARVEEQDAALRRVLTLLVDWVEAGNADRPRADRVRMHAA